MSAPATPVFKWNVNPPWEHFSSLVRESAAAVDAPSDFHRYHHVRAALYFAIGSIEAFLNQEMRRHLKTSGVLEEEILRKLKDTRFRKKATSWPTEIAGSLGSAVQLPSDLLDQLIGFNSLRGEVTHEKGKDHSVYVELDKVSPEEVVKTAREYIIRADEGLGRNYPYWLTGWNFVGMNGKAEWPCLMNNQQFMMALRHIGFDVPHALVAEMDAWESEYMTSLTGFESVSAALLKSPCQPRDSRFPLAPRLCQKWWDDEHLKTCGEERPYPLPRFA